MKTVKEQILLWKDNINCNNYKDIIREFQTQITDHQWSLNEEVRLAVFCLVALNLKAKQYSKNNSIKRELSWDIYDLSKLCCKSVAKCWEYVSIDFPAGVYYICVHLIATELIEEALEISQYIYEYQSAHNVTVPVKDKPDVIYLLILMYLNKVEKLELSLSNVDVTSKIWNFVISKIGSSVRNDNIHKLFQFFVSFVLKSSRSPIDSYTDICSSSMKCIIRQICKFEENPELIFLKICCQVVCEICELSVSKKKNCLLLECFKTFRSCYENASVAVDICHSMVYIAIRKSPDVCSMNDLVTKCNLELKSLFSQQSATLKEVIFFSCVVMIKMHNWSPEEVAFHKDCAKELFGVLFTFAKKLRDINLNELFCGLQNHEAKKNIFLAALIYNLIPYFANAIVDLDLNDATIYSSVLEAQKLSFQLISECWTMEKAKRLHLFLMLGASSVNICRAYMKAELYDKCLELSIIASQGFISVPFEELSNSNIETCLYKLIVCICNSYRSKGLWGKALKVACIWMIILPHCENSLMDVYGSMKGKLYSSKTEVKHLEVICADLLKKKDNTWKHRNLNCVNILNLLYLELKQYLKHNIPSTALIHKILQIIEKKEKSIAKKAECYIVAVKILTNTNTKQCLNYVKNLLKNIDFLINVLKENCNAMNIEQTVLLGDLYYMKFRIKLLIMRSENESEVKILNSMKKPSIAEPGMEQDLKESCDILPLNYTYISSQTELISLLDLAMENWCTYIHNKCLKLDLSHLRDVGLIYRLYCDKAKEIKAWKLLYVAAVLVDDPENIVFGFSNLLNTTWNIKEDWRENVEKNMLARVSESNRLYYDLNHLSRCLVDGFNIENVEILSNISVEQVKKYNLWAQYCQLMAECQFRNIVPSKRSPFLMSFHAYSTIMHVIKNGTWKNLGQCCELQSLLFDVVLFMVNRNLDIYQVLEAKSYLVDSIDLIQKLNIPLRTCQFLIVSARLDTITCSFQDCYLKLQNSSNILDVEQSTCSSEPYIIKPLKSPTHQSPTLNSDFRSACDADFVHFQTSPVLEQRLKFRLPSFADHDSNCDCSMCSNHEYLRLYCETVFLFAVYCRLSNKLNDAHDYLTGVSKTFEMIENRLRTRISSQFSALKVRITAEFSNYWFVKGDLERSEMFNDEALKYSPTKYLEIYVECVERSCAIIETKLLKIGPLKRDNSSTVRSARKVTARRKPQISPILLKTPMGKLSQNSFVDVKEEKDDLATDVTPFPRRSRRALFDRFVTPAKPAKKKTQMSTPPDIVLQTPSTIEKRIRKIQSVKKG